MKACRLTARAETRLVQIAEWTIRHFGKRQAKRYENQLIKHLALLATGKLPRGRPCGLLLPDRAVSEEIYYLQVGKHYIVHRDRADLIVVLDFVHSSRDLPAIVKRVYSHEVGR